MTVSRNTHKRLSGELVKQMWLVNRSTALDAVIFPDREHPGMQRIAVLRTRAATGQVDTAIIDPMTGGSSKFLALGSVSQKVAHDSPCACLTVHQLFSAFVSAADC